MRSGAFARRPRVGVDEFPKSSHRHFESIEAEVAHHGGVLGQLVLIAERLVVSAATVKTHVKRLYRKTDTSRHADLVKLVASYSSPLAGSA